MLDANKLTPSPGDDNNKLVESLSSANTLDLRRDAYPQSYGAQAESKVHLRDYWRIVRRRLWVPISVVLLVVTLTTIYMLRSPSIFEGQTTIQIDREDTASLNISKEFNIVGPEDSQFINTQLKNLQSPTMAYKVAKVLDLEHNPKFLTGKGKEAANNNTLITSGGDDQQADRERLAQAGYIGALLGSVDITRLRETRLIQIKYRHTDRDMAKKVTDTWAEVFKDDSLATRKQGTRDTASFLEEQISRAKLDLLQSEEKLMNYRRNNQVIDFGDSKQNTVIDRLAELNSQLLTAENERKSLQAFYELSRTLTDLGTLPEIQADSQVQNINKGLTDLREKKAKLDVEYTPEWPEVKQVVQQIEQLENERRAAYKRIQTSLENRYHTAVEREKFLRAAFSEQKGETVQQQGMAVNARMLQQAVDTNRDLYTKLLTSQKDVTVSSAGIKSNIRITDYSSMPRTPVAPKRTQNILLSFLLSLVGGVGLALFIDYVNNKIESVEDIDRHLHIPVLGVIPVFPVESKERQRVMGESAKKQLQPGSGSVLSLKPDTGTALVEIDNSSSIAESYRQLRTAVLLSSASHAPRTILVTSSQPAEGKTTTSTNLAISLSQTGSSVLIVDCDLRRPRLHKVFGVKNSRGLSNYLSGTGELAALVQPALPNLFVLPVGPLPPNPAELLGSNRMKQTVELLQNSFDYVILDSPPVASFADSLILSAMVEGVIIVVKAGQTSREMANRTKTHLQTVGAKVLGAVINHIKLQPHDYYYYSTYYSRYYYRDESSETGEEKQKD